MAKTRYLLALGSNQRHVRHGFPEDIIRAAFDRLDESETQLVRRSKIIRSAPLGPSSRRYANAVIVIETELSPLPLLTRLLSIEQQFGRRRGQRWSRRVLDIDILLWEGGMFASDDPSLIIPHPEFRNRDFVLEPASTVAPDWRDPVGGLTIAQIWRRRRRPKNCKQ